MQMSVLQVKIGVGGMGDCLGLEIGVGLLDPAKPITLLRPVCLPTCPLHLACAPVPRAPAPRPPSYMRT